MGMPLTDLVLLVVTIIIVIVDIILAVCLRFILPNHLTSKGYYPADGSKRSFTEAADICPCLLRVFPDGTSEDITFNKISHKAEAKRALNDAPTEQLKRYSFLVSLSIPAYSDVPEQKIFACNGLILSSERLLTTNNCVREESEWYNLTVRSESPYWSRFGKVHSVVGVVPGKYRDYVELKVSPKFSNSVLPLQPIEYPFDGNWTYAVSIGWNDNMYKQDVNFRYKYKHFEIEQWTSKNYTAAHRQVCFESSRCKRVSSKLLLTSCHQVVGMEACEGFSGFSLNRLEEKDCYPIFKDDGSVKDVEVC